MQQPPLIMVGVGSVAITLLDQNLQMTHFTYCTVMVAEQQVGISDVAAIEAWLQPNLRHQVCEDPDIDNNHTC